MAHSMYGMTSVEHHLLQYVICTCVERDPELVLTMTYDGALDLIQQAGLESCGNDPFDDPYDDDYGDE